LFSQPWLAKVNASTTQRMNSQSKFNFGVSDTNQRLWCLGLVVAHLALAGRQVEPWMGLD
jgi:hypothetical protein